MMSNTSLLTLNGGSSSIRFAWFAVEDSLRLLMRGKLDRVGARGTTFTVNDASGAVIHHRALDTVDRSAAVNALLTWLESQPAFAAVNAVGHRVVHGMTHASPELITTTLLDELRRIMPFAPEHLPCEMELIEAIRQRHPDLRQVACFDTAFHRNMPRVAKLLTIPRRYQTAGVERYGFHGLSYSYLMEELARLGDSSVATGRVILAHLGNGASLAAVRDGQSIDTSMGFTPAAGLMMSTRTGDIDPGLLCYLEQTERLNTQQLQHMIHHESGLLGVSETGSDMRDLLAREVDDVRAAEAVMLYCYQARKWIGSFAAALGGLDTLVFAGGIGENASLIRERICKELDFIGIQLHATRNADNAAVISTDSSRVTVRVIRTDEELMIARSVKRVLSLGVEQDT